MVFGLTRNDANFQTLDESCAFSCFDDIETSESAAAAAATSAANDDLGQSGQQYLGGNHLLASLEASDLLDDDSDSNLLGDLMPYLINTKNFVRAPSMNSDSKGPNGDNSESARAAVLRAPSMDRPENFARIDKDDNDSESSNSIDDFISNNYNKNEIAQLEIPGITTAVPPKNNPIPLHDLMKRGDKGMGNLHNYDASMAFTTCFDIADPITIILTMEEVSMYIMELESLGIIDMATIQRIEAHMLQKCENISNAASATNDKSSDDTNRLTGGSRDPSNQTSTSRTDNVPITDNVHTPTTTPEEKLPPHDSSGDRQSERTELKQGIYSSPDRKRELVRDKAKAEQSDETNASSSQRRMSPGQRLLNRENKDEYKVVAAESSVSKQGNVSTPKKTKSRRSNLSREVESMNNPTNTNDRIGNDKLKANRPKPRRSNSCSSVDSLRREDDTKICNEDTFSPIHDRTNSGDKITFLHSGDQQMSDISSPTKRQKSILGNTGKMMKKFLSSRYLVQEKERPNLVKSESQSAIGSPRRGLDNSFHDSKEVVVANDLIELDGHVVEGVVPFTPRSQKRFLNWRTNTAKKSINNFGGHLIEGELEISGADIRFQYESEEATTMPQLPVAKSDDTFQKIGTAPSNVEGKSKRSSEVGKKDADLRQTKVNELQNQSPSKESKSTNNTAPRPKIRRMSMSENRSSSVNRKSDGFTSSSHARDNTKSSATSYAKKSNNSKEDLVPGQAVDSRTSSNNHDAIKSPTKSRLTISRGLSQSVHVSPTKKLGKGSSTGVTRRQRILATTTPDDMPVSSTHETQTHSLSNNKMNQLELSKPLNEPSIQIERNERQPTSDPASATMNSDSVGASRHQKNLSQSLHVSALKKKVGKNTEIPGDPKSRNKTPSKVSSKMDSRSGIDGSTERKNNDQKPTVSTRTRKTTCEELKKELVLHNTNDDDNAMEPVLVKDETAGRKRRNSIGMPIMKVLNNKAAV